MTLSVLCTLLVTQALKSWWGCWLQLSQVALVPASPALYYSHGLMTIVDRAVNVYTVILLERQSKHTIQHVCPATSSANTFYMLNVQPNNTHMGQLGVLTPHRLWENLKVTKLCRLMEAVNVKRARCLVLRVNHRHKVLRLLSSNGREVKIWESNISKTYLWNFKDWWSKYIKVMEIQSDDWKGMAALALELVWNGLNDPNLSTSHDIPSYRLVDRGP